MDPSRILVVTLGWIALLPSGAHALGDFLYRLDRAEVIGNASGGAGCSEDFSAGLGGWTPALGMPVAVGGLVEFEDPGEVSDLVSTFHDVEYVREDLQSPGACQLSSAGGPASLITEWVATGPGGPGDYYGHQLVYALSLTSAESIAIQLRTMTPDVAAELGVTPGLRVELLRLELDTSDPGAIVLAAPIDSQSVPITKSDITSATGNRIYLRLDYAFGTVDASYSLDGGASFLPVGSTVSSFDFALGPGLFWAGAGAITLPPPPAVPALPGVAGPVLAALLAVLSGLFLAQRRGRA